MDPYDYFDIVLGLVFAILFAVLFWRIGDIEYEKGYLTGLASLAVSVIVLFPLHKGYLEIVIGHILLFGAFWVFNLRKSKV
ncbi:hypothetical protein Acid345_3511 [Candidatus Koribacter versatilis Ellin345]|uniref:Uncharacterized protein n=1 Tax=Koribacter versatilis (strain Ellin345) TaxID=204669 RepID=Q1IKT8_KORVE|nr:hypothetical protein [Candidatus Koribacter versatilis]ABF42512.1 hypothetical protein Acid345_3511 [Candidatus Koribacter versatilis Ellin345]